MNTNSRCKVEINLRQAARTKPTLESEPRPS